MCYTVGSWDWRGGHTDEENKTIRKTIGSVATPQSTPIPLYDTNEESGTPNFPPNALILRPTPKTEPHQSPTPAPQATRTPSQSIPLPALHGTLQTRPRKLGHVFSSLRCCLSDAHDV